MKIDRALIFHRSTFPGSGAHGRRPIEPSFFKEYPQAPRVELPRETLGGAEELRRVIVKRRSCREFSPEPLTLQEISDLLYLTIGVTAVTEAYGIENFPLRAAPSAGALAPIELYPIFFNPPEGLEERGLYHYNALKHVLEFLIEGDLSEPLVDACLGQEFLAQAPMAILFTAVYPRSSWKYGIRAYRYIHLDAGFAGENLYLAATSMGLGTVAIGAFDDEKLSALLGFDEEELPMLVMPVGKKPS